MLVVLDTNIIYQALRSNEGASNFILQLIRHNKVDIALSLPVFQEYEAVLKRKKSLSDFKLNIRDINKILTFISFKGLVFDIYYLIRPNLQDEADNMFIELAFTSNAEYLITSNIKDYTKNTNLKFDGFKIITPSEFVKNWRNENEKFK